MLFTLYRGAGFSLRRASTRLLTYEGRRYSASGLTWSLPLLGISPSGWRDSETALVLDFDARAVKWELSLTVCG
jgi:hypothetical protein